MYDKAAIGHQWRDAVDLDAAAPPFDKNPSAWSQRWPIAVLAGIAVLISSYMALFQVELIDSVWDPVFGDGTETVLTSKSAEKMDRWLRVPDAAFGAWGYLSEVVLGLVGSTRRWQYRPWMVILFGLDVIPLGIVSAVLVVVQGITVGSWCFLCLITAAISVILIFFAYDEVWASLRYLWRFWKHTRSGKRFWHVFWGGADPDAERIALER